jgi:uncharacterized membrane protein
VSLSFSFRRFYLLGIVVLLAAFVPAARVALANSYVVTNLADDGSSGTLREAITLANASVGTNDSITFTVAGIINLASTLPPLTDPAGVTIDASSSTAPKVPTIELRGYNSATQVAQEGPGIEIASSNNIIRGLAINGFAESSTRLELVGAGIVVNGHDSATPLTNNLIEYCYVGTDLSGNAAGPGAGFNNASAGIVLEYGAQNTTIQHNVISGNFGQGIYLQSSVSSGKFQQNNTIVDNKIGVNAAGTQALPNGASGIFVSNNSNTTTIGPGNIISGNGGHGNARSYGVLIAGSTTGGGAISGNVVKGNLIGTDVTGTIAIPNTGDGDTSGGIGIGTAPGLPAQGTTVGGPNAADGNLISGNQLDGIAITGITGDTAFTTGNAIIQNNTIGVKVDGLTPLANTRAGINLQGATQQNTITGNSIFSNATSGIVIQSGGAIQPLAPRQNTISANKLNGNTGDGILVSGAGAVGNHITQTTTNANGGKGIALASGGNLGDQPNRPGLSGVTFSGSPPTLAGTVTNAASCGVNGACTIEVFGGDSALSDEGPAYLGAFSVKSSAGSFSNISLAACKPFLIFTVTDSAGNTSEFISPIGPVPTDCPPPAPVVALSDATPSPSQNALAGDTKVFTHTVANIGTSAAALTVSKLSSNGWTTTLDTSACPATLTPSQSCDITLSVAVPGDAQAGQSNSTTITAALAGAAATVQKIDTTTVVAAPALDLAPDNQVKTIGPGQPVSFGHTLTNLGNGTDTFIVTVAPPSGWSYSVQPAGDIQLAPSALVSITVTYTPTAGLASPPDYVGLVTVKSATDQNVSKTVTDTITIVSAAVPQIASVVTPPSVDPGGTVQIDYTITNVGNLTGTFDLNFSGPGWPIGDTVPPTVSLAPAAGRLISTTLTVPVDAIAGAYPATLTATNQLTSTIAASKTDLIHVTPHATLALEPDQAFTRAPNAIYTDTLTLTNNGNFTDTISLVAGSSSGWNVQVLSPTVTLDPGANSQVKVETRVPPGLLADFVATTTVTATSSLPGVSDPAVITTTIAAVPGVELTPASQELTVLAGNSATFNFTLINSGSITQSFTITATNVPAGWDSSLAPLSTAVLQPGETVPLTLTLTAPGDAADGTVANVTLTATCVEDSCSDSALATARVGPPVDTKIGEDCTQAVLPGTLITCRHTITNTGSISGTFGLTLTSKLGWTATYTPSAVFLAPGSTKNITLTIVVPTSAPASVAEMLILTARSTQFPGVTRQVSDTITVLQFAGVSFTPSLVRPLTPGQTITFLHTLQNIGNGLDRFNITTSQDFNWPITVTPLQTASLAPGVNFPVEVRVQVPANVPPKTINRIKVRATSVFSPTVFMEVTDTVGAPDAPFKALYLPWIVKK